jgi:hypothetical protein
MEKAHVLRYVRSEQKARLRGGPIEVDYVDMQPLGRHLHAAVECAYTERTRIGEGMRVRPVTQGVKLSKGRADALINTSVRRRAVDRPSAR